MKDDMNVSETMLHVKILVYSRLTYIFNALSKLRFISIIYDNFISELIGYSTNITTYFQTTYIGMYTPCKV